MVAFKLAILAAYHHLNCGAESASEIGAGKEGERELEASLAKNKETYERTTSCELAKAWKS